ncbi:MAG: amino acid permease [Bacteroidetes bacterium]|nr:amino acid permease [Bacteroidota bacterium]
MTTISTILGAILFLRFGYAVGHQGFLGAIGIILLGHMVTVPTAMAVAEIATNQKVQGGGAYYIISRSFGLNIGSAIGITLYLSQAISVAFYVIAFSEAFDPLIRFLHYEINTPMIDKRWISIFSMGILAVLILTRGANIGMKALYLVVTLLFTSLLFFFLGKPTNPEHEFLLSSHIRNPDSFFYVFTIIFPAFTGLVAGLGLSGDLRNPSKSIPRGTLWATVGGFVVYILVAYKLAASASAQELASDQLIMEKISMWGPIIPIGLAAASLSSALGSIMVAPRTLQAMGNDTVFPGGKLNNWLSKGKDKDNEPTNAGLVSIIIAFVFVAFGDIDFVAQIIAMFFMVTYGVICLISLLEHFAADPSYRPTFKSRWYLSLLGTVTSFWLMFKMNAPYALLSLIIMAGIYVTVSGYNRKEKGLVNLFRGVVFQLSRQLQILAQRADREDLNEHWRPFTICVSQDTFMRRSAFDMLRWISLKYGFGTYIHYIKGFLTEKTNKESRAILNKLIHLAAGSKNRVYLDTIISPSYTSAIAQVIQLSGISGKGNNMILFEFSQNNPGSLEEALNTHDILYATGFDLCILNTSYKGFGYKKRIHIWIKPDDYDNANLMILLGYIILGHPEWKVGIINIYVLYRPEEAEKKRDELKELIKEGRLPISMGNISMVSAGEEKTNRQVIGETSADADLTIIGFRHEQLKTEGYKLYTDYDKLGNILFVSANKKKEIK